MVLPNAWPSQAATNENHPLRPSTATPTPSPASPLQEWLLIDDNVPSFANAFYQLVLPQLECCLVERGGWEGIKDGGGDQKLPRFPPSPENLQC